MFIKTNTTFLLLFYILNFSVLIYIFWFSFRGQRCSCLILIALAQWSDNDSESNGFISKFPLVRPGALHACMHTYIYIHLYIYTHIPTYIPTYKQTYLLSNLVQRWYSATGKWFRIDRRQIVFLCWDQESKLGVSGTPADGIPTHKLTGLLNIKSRTR